MTCRRAELPWVCCKILSSSTGYLVMRCVTSRMNSGTSLRLTRELLLCCCAEKTKTQDWLLKEESISQVMPSKIRVLGTYSDKVLKFFVLLLELFENMYSLHVVTAELSIQLLHPLRVLIRKLRHTVRFQCKNVHHASVYSR